MFYDYVTRPGSNLRVGLHAKGPPSDPDMYSKYENKVWIESDNFLTRMATLFLSGDEKKRLRIRLAETENR